MLAISQEELAERADVDRTYVGTVERGETNVSFEGILKFLHALGRSWTELGSQLDRELGLKGRLKKRNSEL